MQSNLPAPIKPHNKAAILSFISALLALCIYVFIIFLGRESVWLLMAYLAALLATVPLSIIGLRQRQKKYLALFTLIITLLQLALMIYLAWTVLSDFGLGGLAEIFKGLSEIGLIDLTLDGFGEPKQ